MRSRKKWLGTNVLWVTYHEIKIGSIENGVNDTGFKKTKTASDAAVVRENDCCALPSFMQKTAVVNKGSTNIYIYIYIYIYIN